MAWVQNFFGETGNTRPSPGEVISPPPRVLGRVKKEVYYKYKMNAESWPFFKYIPWIV